MSFCKFSTEYYAKSYTVIDNLFFTRYLPSTAPKHASIYLYGLFICSQNDNLDVQRFAENMGYSIEEIIESFEYWEEQGIVRIVNSEPFQVQYLPIRNIGSSNRKYDKDKYFHFNIEVQKILSDRMITPNELEEYYTLMEGYSLPDGRKISPEALLMIIRFCAQNKGTNVNYRYIITVARDWASAGFITPEQVEKRLETYSTAGIAVANILKALGSTKKTSLDEHQFYLKWTEMGFNDDCLIYIAKSLKKSGRANFEKLDKKVVKYFELHLLSQKEIDDYESNLDKIYSLAREINKTLGLYYEDVSNQIDTYITPWLNMGYESEILLQIAQECYLRGKRTLSALNDTINDLYAQGIVSKNAYSQYNLSQQDVKENFGKILKKLGLERNVTSFDMDYWRRWTTVWAFNEELINYATELAEARGANISYINSILADWYTQKIFTLEQAKLASENYRVAKAKTSSTTKINSRKYTKEDNENIYNKFDELEI
ncbi:MAG: DnaD domain protein [Clostridia bacterium]|nr:DnaD domain protein [Clostridia bacterium]